MTSILVEGNDALINENTVAPRKFESESDLFDAMKSAKYSTGEMLHSAYLALRDNKEPVLLSIESIAGATAMNSKSKVFDASALLAMNLATIIYARGDLYSFLFEIISQVKKKETDSALDYRLAKEFKLSQIVGTCAKSVMFLQKGGLGFVEKAED